MNDFTVKFDLADSEYMTALRLVVGAVCATADIDVDACEDMKVCVTESCLILKNCGFEGVKVSLGCKGGVHATVQGTGGEPHACDNEFSLALVSALLSSCDISVDRQSGAICKLILKL